MAIQTGRWTMDRRRFFAGAMAAGGAFFTERGLFAQALTLTPATTEGPYYPDTLPLDQNNDLLVVNDNITPGIGTVAWMSGRVLDRNGSPVRNAIVEIWQADNYGSYIHSRGVNSGQRDSNFQGYGTFETASDGQYLFRTIKPGLYPGRVRHVHCKVTLPGGTSLTTQLHIEGETAGNDTVLSAITNAAQLAAVIRPWNAISGSPIGALAVNWDIVMNWTPSDTSSIARPTLSAVGGVTNGASFRRGAVGGSWVTLSGNTLATTTRIWEQSDFIATGKLPTTIDGVSVRINNEAASVYYISPTQVNVLAPDTANEQTVSVSVTNARGTSDTVNIPLRPVMPAFFQFPSEYVAAVRADGTLLAPPGLISGATTVPAQPGETIQLFGTGFGPVTPAVAAGEIVSEPRPVAAEVKVRIDSHDAAVTYAGLISAGLYQVNVTVPAGLADGDYPVTVSAGGTRSLKFARLAVARQTSARTQPVRRRLDKTERRELFALLQGIRDGRVA